MEKTDVKSIFADINKYLGKETAVSGWIRTIRAGKAVAFIELNDGTFFKNIQIVLESGAENYAEVSKLGTGSAVEVCGTVAESEGEGQSFEIKASRVLIVGKADEDFPLQKKRHTFEYLRTIAHLRPRTNTFNAVFRVRSIASHAVHSFFQERGFVYVHTPIITGSDCEGAGEMFRVTTLDLENTENIEKTDTGRTDFSRDFFGRETNLTVSGQLAVENYCAAFRNVYTFGPTFRAENSNTMRHASEFWMIEPEASFADLKDNMQLAEDMLKHLIKYVLEKAPAEMEFFNSFIDKGLIERLEFIVESDFARITYTEAVDLLGKSGRNFEYPVKWGIDLQTEHERYLTEEALEKPVFVYNYPKEIKAFYMRLNDDEKTVASMDLLVPGIGEIIGGSQREERYDILAERIREAGLKEKDYWWYLDLRRYGTNPHAGFGLGFERALMYITGMQNIRDVIPFPRTPRNAEF